MPKAKKRGKGGKGDKEKPLLTIQGVLRLEKSFVTEQHEGAETVKVQIPGEENPIDLKLIPGQSEHEKVAYKAGYDVGPSNPFPQNQPEKDLFEEKRKVDAVNENFKELKKQSEDERMKREQQFRKEGLLPEEPPGDAAPTGAEHPEKKKFDPEAANPDNPKNYFLPENIHSEPAFHNNEPLQFGMVKESPPPSAAVTNGTSNNGLVRPKDQSPSAEITPSPDNQSVAVEDACIDEPNEQIGTTLGSKNSALGSEENSVNPFNSNEETPVMDCTLLPTMKPLPEESQFGRDMVLDVALQMEEVRRQKRMERKRRVKEAEDAGLAPDAEDMDREGEDADDTIYSLDEIQEMKKREEEVQRNQAQGPEISEANMQQVGDCTVTYFMGSMEFLPLRQKVAKY